MSLLRGPLRVTRLVLEGPLPPRDQVEAALESHRFVPPASPSSGERRVGFVDPHDPLRCTFTDVTRWSTGPYWLFSLRADQKKLPSAWMKAHLAQRIAAWCVAQGRDRCPAPVRAEIKEILVLEGLASVLPTMQTQGLLVNTQDRVVLVEGTSATALDEARKFLRRLGLPVEPDGPLHWVDDPAAAAALADRCAHSGAHFPPGVLAEFLAWAWVHLGAGESLTTSNTTTWVDGTITFRERGDEHACVTVASPDAPHAKETRAALRSDRVFASLGLEIRREDREYRCTLGTPSLDLAGAHLPGLIKTGDWAEILSERMFLYEELHALLREMVTTFAVHRASPDWTTDTVARVQAAMDEQDEEDAS